MKDIRTKIGEGGRVILPSAFRQKLNLEVGSDIILHMANNEIYITTPHQALKNLQEKVKRNMETLDKRVSLVDELITTRRTEASKNE